MNKLILIYIVGIAVGIFAYAGNLLQALLVCVAGGIIAGHLISKFSKEVK